MASVSLKLLVLKTPQVERLRAFYQALGIELAEERHGSGPVHHAGNVGEAVLEVYPLSDDGGTADTTTRWASPLGTWPRSSRPSGKLGLGSPMNRSKQPGGCKPSSVTRTAGPSNCTRADNNGQGG